MIARSVQNKSLLKQLHSLSSCVKSPRVHKELPTFCQSRRHLHANWSYLLNNVWLYKNGGKDNNCNRIGRGYVDGIYESDSPSDDLDMPSVLFLHDAFADHQMCFELAKDLVNASSENNISRLQCFLADVRGCGDSDGDDYAPPHTIQNAAEDVLTLVQAACAFPYTKQPFVIVAYGTLGKALAHYYADWTINQGGVTANTHSEVSGEGAVIPPEHIVLLSLPNLTSAGADFITGTSNMSGSVDCTLGTEDSIKYTFDRAICEEMLTDAGRYLALQENTFQRVAADSVLEAEKACTTGGVGVIKKLAHGRKPLQVIECSDYDSVISYVLKCVDEAK